MLRGVIDTIDGNHARVLIGDEAVAVSIALNHLPPHAREGVVMQVKFTVDQAATNARDAKIRAGVLE